MMKIVLLLLFFTFATISQAHKCNIISNPKYTIHITNNIPNSQITVRCRSKDDDLGFHKLNAKQDYMFQFCQDLFGKTLFACDAIWNKKKASFHGFDLKLGQEDCENYKCRWSVMADGVYFVKKKKSEKRANWTMGPDGVRFDREFSLAELDA